MERNGGRLALSAVIAVVTLLAYFANSSTNPVTGRTQHVALSPGQEIQLGLQSTPTMLARYGGETHDSQLAAYVEQVGERVVARSAAHQTPYRFRFHCLEDRQTVNAFALPGGQVFITRGLLERMTDEAQLAGCLGHEVGHVVGRHGAQQLARSNLTRGLAGAVDVAAYDRHGRGQGVAVLTAAVASLVDLRYGRGDELEADQLGVRLMHEAGYDPRGMIELMEVLQSLGSSRQPEFFSTHPNPEHRIERLQNQLAELGSTGGELGRERFQSHVHGSARLHAPR